MPLVHDCTRPERDDGLPFRCRRFRHVKLDEAEGLVKLGRAYWKKQRRADGQIIKIKTAIVLQQTAWERKPFKRPLLARAISKHDIVRAFVEGNKYEQDRIAAYGGERDDLSSH